MGHVIHLCPRLDLSAAEGLLDDLRAIPDDAFLQLDACEVTHFSAICLQPVIAKARAMRAAGGHLQFEGLTHRVVGQLKSLGTTPAAISEDDHDN